MAVRNILVIYNSFEPYRIPLFNELAKQKGIHLMVLFLSRSSGGKEMYEKYLPGIHFNFTVLPGIKIPISGTLQYFINFSIIPYLTDDTYDLVITLGWQHFADQVMIIARMLRHKPYALWSDSTSQEDSIQRQITSPFVRWIVKHASACVAGGTAAKEYLQKLGSRKNNIFIAFNTVDIIHFAKTSAISLRMRQQIRKNCGTKRDDTVILSVGQFIHRKGLDLLIRAFADVVLKRKDVSLWIIGQGPMKKRYQAIIKELKLTKYVHIVPYVANPKLAMYYGAADIFVLPSREDTWGLVVNEAMACGLPVIVSTSAGSAKDLVRQGENGYTLAIEDHRALVSCIQRLIESPELRVTMGRRSARLIGQYTATDSTQTFMQAILHSMHRV